VPITSDDSVVAVIGALIGLIGTLPVTYMAVVDGREVFIELPQPDQIKVEERKADAVRIGSTGVTEQS
jgi:hypothetical protein